MDQAIKNAINYVASNDDPKVSKIIHDLIDLVNYYHERDAVSDAKLELCRKLNSNYREHVVKLIRDSEQIDSKLQTLADTNFGMLD